MRNRCYRRARLGLCLCPPIRWRARFWRRLILRRSRHASHPPWAARSAHICRWTSCWWFSARRFTGVHGAVANAVGGAVLLFFTPPGCFVVPKTRLGWGARNLQRLASKIRLNGVCAARRKVPKPASVTTLRMRSSPACAPSAAPTSCASEAGVQIMVEAE